MTEKTANDNAAATIGNKNPPLASRFKPGQSGNPAGRPKGSGLLREALLKAALEERTNKEWQGKTQKGSALQVLLHDCFHRAINGDSKATNQVLSLAMRLLDDSE